MKLNEIKHSLSKVERESIARYIEGCIPKLPKKYYKINFDGEVSIDCPASISPAITGPSVGTSLPFKFKNIALQHVNCEFYINMSPLVNLIGMPRKINCGLIISTNYKMTSLEGCPDVVDGAFAVYRCPIKSWDHAPGIIGGELIVGVSSLIGIHEHIKEVRGGVVKIAIELVKEGGLGLLLMPGLTSLIGNSQTVIDTGPFKIIQQYLGRPEDIFECQAELLEAGYEEFAQL